MASVEAATPQAQFKKGDKLVLAAPAHTGLPNGGNVTVQSTHFDGEAGAWLYNVILKVGSQDHQIRKVTDVREGWMRHEGRIATAKACAPMPFGAYATLAPRLIVPLYQRRYCWQRAQWLQLWQDVVSPRGIGPHATGRVTIARERHAVVIVDGQQRTTTLMLMLCALRDVAVKVGGAGADQLVGVTMRVLTSTRSSKIQRQTEGEADAGDAAEPLQPHSRTAAIGLEGLEGAQSVRLVPSRSDRLPFCSIVLGRPFERAASKAATKMADCYDTFKALAIERLHHEGEQLGDEGSVGVDGSTVAAEVASAVASAPFCATASAATPATEQRASGRAVSTLAKLVKNVLNNIQLVVFELHDGVALQNMYDMLAQRERGIYKLFSNVSGHAMNDVDLVRNMLLNMISDEDERVEAYEKYWIPMEKVQGDGDPALLNLFMQRHLAATMATLRTPTTAQADLSTQPQSLPTTHSTAAPTDAASGDSSASSMAPPPPRPSKADHGGARQPPAVPTLHPLLEDVATVLRHRGGSAGSASLYAQVCNAYTLSHSCPAHLSVRSPSCPSPPHSQGLSSENAAPVDPTTAGRVAVDFLREMSEAAVREEA